MGRLIGKRVVRSVGSTLPRRRIRRKAIDRVVRTKRGIGNAPRWSFLAVRTAGAPDVDTDARDPECAGVGRCERHAVKADVVGTVLRAGMGATHDLGNSVPDARREDAAFSTWSPATFSLSLGVEPNMAPHLERMLATRTRLKRGQPLYQLGARFHALYALRTGTCKSVLLSRDGQDQIVGYHIAGEIVGIDGIATDAHECEATALEDMDVCPLPFDQIDDIARISDQFRRNFVKLLSRENARTRGMMMMLGTMRAEQRLAVFLLDLAQRYCARGYSSHEFVLRMTRAEIGSYLGLKLETTSRLFSRFQRAGLVHVRGRAVKLLDRISLCEIVETGAAQPQRADADAERVPTEVQSLRA